MRPETESLEGLGDSLAKAMRCNARVAFCLLWPFVFYCLTVKIGTLGEQPLLAADSTDRCNTFRELVCWGLIEQGLSGPFIELPCYRAEFGLAM